MKVLKMNPLFTILNMSKAVIALVLGLVFLAPAVKAQNNVVDEVIAVVGADAILKSDVEEMFYRVQAQGYDYEGDLKCKLFEDMLIQKLLLTQAGLDSLEVSENQVISQVEAQINYYMSQLGSREKMEEYFNKTTFEIKEELRTAIREQNLTEQMKDKITEGISATPAEVRNYFKGLKEDEVPTIPTTYEIQQIVFQPQIEQEEIDRVKDKLRGYRDRINAGEDFAVLAILYSEDDGTSRRGGELGFMGRGMLVPEFADVAFNLRDPSKVSRVVETEYGYHIIQLIERRGNKVNCRHILMKPKVSAAAKEEAKTALDSLVMAIDSSEITFEEAALYYSFDKDSRSNGGLIANPATGSSRFEISDQNLTPDIAKQAQNMKPGEISKPFSYINAQGKEVVAVIKVKSKTPLHKANMKDDYQELREMVLDQKKKDKLETWIHDKQRDTYISIDDDWKGCDYEYAGW